MAVSALKTRWTPADSLDLYNIRGWGNDYFSISTQGHLEVHPGGSGSPAIDLKELVDEVARARHRPAAADPLLRRSSRRRVVELNEAFRRAIAEYGYKGGYRGVYPIKVNQHRYVVERIVEFGRPYHYGLEAGSKPELLAVMALLEDEEALIVCNGYKDEEYIETALLASQARPQGHPRGREALRARADPRDLAPRPGCGRASASAPSCRPRAPGAGKPRAATARSSASPARELVEAIGVPARARHARLLRAAALPPRQPDLRHPHGQERAARGGAASTSSWRSWARRCSTSTSAAAWASTTTARRPTSPRR